MGILKFFGIGQRNKELLSEATQNGAVVIDVRTKEEYDTGHFKGSMNIPLNTLSSKISKIKEMKQPLIICCASGMRSASAASQLKNEGIDCIDGGSWKNL